MNKTSFVIALYLFAIVSANSFVAFFGVGANFIMSFIFIAFNLVSRDYLHEAWVGDYKRMGVLIASGSILTYLVNRDAGEIALASFVAFTCAGITDYIVYQFYWTKPRMIKANASNVASSLVDSIIFTILAFGWQGALLIIAIDWIVKVVGGVFWVWIFFGRTTQRA